MFKLTGSCRKLSITGGVFVLAPGLVALVVPNIEYGAQWRYTLYLTMSFLSSCSSLITIVVVFARYSFQNYDGRRHARLNRCLTTAAPTRYKPKNLPKPKTILVAHHHTTAEYSNWVQCKSRAWPLHTVVAVLQCTQFCRGRWSVMYVCVAGATTTTTTTTATDNGQRATATFSLQLNSAAIPSIACTTTFTVSTSTNARYL